MRILQNSTNMPISAELAEKLLAEIKEKKWWQGSLISGNDLSKTDKAYAQAEWWIITSQTCNLYNPCFEKIPVFEIVAARKIEKCDSGKIRGDNPRILHIEAQSNKEIIALEINIMDRLWCPRQYLGDLPAPTFYVRDAERGTDPDWLRKQWLDKFIAWLARSYTRVTLPDAFNDALEKSKIKNVLERKLTTDKDKLYGIYLSIEQDSEIPWKGVLGEMLPPYLLNIVLAVYEDVDPEPIKAKLLSQIFNNEITDPESIEAKKLTRAELARRYGIRLIDADIEALSVAEITLLRIKSLIRYSSVDHFSDSSMAAS